MQHFNVDPKFSVYRLVKRSLRDKSVLNHRRTMSIISSEIENATLADGAKTVVFASFQRMSRFLPQIPRYRKLAQAGHHVYVFGVPDVTLPEIENLTYVPVKPTDQLAKEWFIVSFGRDYFTALATEELTSIDDPDANRQFKGIWTFDVFVVGTLHEWLSNVVGMRIEQRLDDEHDYLSQAQLMLNTMERMQKRVAESQRDATMQDELQKLMEIGLYPALTSMQKDQTQETLRAPLRTKDS